MVVLHFFQFSDIPRHHGVQKPNQQPSPDKMGAIPFRLIMFRVQNVPLASQSELPV